MRKLSILLALVAGLFTFPAYADFTGKDASAATITFKNPGTCTAVVCVPVAQLYDGTNVVTLSTAGADGASNTLTGVPVYSRTGVYNGSTWDRWTGAVTVASLPLPTGAATSALQTTGNTSLATIATNSGTQATAANQSTGNTSLASIVTNTTGIATAANQTAANTSLATIATNTGAAIPTQAVTVPIGGVTNDPCQYATKTNAAIATSSGTVQLVAPSGSTQVYVCSFSLIAASTAVVNLVGGTGATCTTGTPVASVGSTTAGNGMSLAANGGLTFGNGGATATRTTTAGHGLCLIQSGTTALAGNITYVQQ